MFIGREQELNTLNTLYRSDKFEFTVIYGRRRVGKTALISKFTKGKDTIFFTGVETNAKQNLDNLSRCIMEYNTGIIVDSSFASFQSALEYVFELAKTKRIVLVIDEYPYVARASKSLASTLQLLIDKNKGSSKLSKGTTFHTVRRKQKAGKHNMRCSFPLFFYLRIYILYFSAFEMHTPNL